MTIRSPASRRRRTPLEHIRFSVLPERLPVFLQRITSTPFAAITRAPDRGYARDSIVTVQAGETVLLQLYGSGCTFGEPFYAKVSIDSVIVAERRIVFTSMVNRNCGFRGLVPGLPTN